MVKFQHRPVGVFWHLSEVGEEKRARVTAGLFVFFGAQIQDKPFSALDQHLTQSQACLRTLRVSGRCFVCDQKSFCCLFQNRAIVVYGMGATHDFMNKSWIHVTLKCFKAAKACALFVSFEASTIQRERERERELSEIFIEWCPMTICVFRKTVMRG